MAETVGGVGMAGERQGWAGNGDGGDARDWGRGGAGHGGRRPRRRGRPRRDGSSAATEERAGRWRKRSRLLQ